MRFGIFYEHQLPRPWGPDSEHKLLSDALEQIELADRSGIDYAWEVEHHFLKEYLHSSAPEVFLAAASQRTADPAGPRHRPGPVAVNHPARISAGRHPGPGLGRTGRLRHRGATSRPSSADSGGAHGRAGDVGGDARRRHADVVEKPLRRRRRLRHDAAALRAAQAAAEAASAALGGLQPPGDHRPRRAQRHRRAVVLVRRAGGRGALGGRVLRPDRLGGVRARGFAVNPNVAVVLPMMLTPMRRPPSTAASTARTSSATR